MSERIVATDGHEGHWYTGEEIVRCSDCRCFTPEGTIRFPDGSTNTDFCSYFKAYKLQITPDGFCAWGERRDA